jgi:two-component system, cell cycle response regulator DivK
MAHALIIDDDLNNLMVLQQLLEHLGLAYTAIQDSTLVENILAEIGPLDVIFLDLEMPDLNGYQLFDYLKAQPELQTVPIVACTVHTGELHQARNLGFHSFISKPLDVHRFPGQLQKILSGQSVWDAR